MFEDIFGDIIIITETKEKSNNRIEVDLKDYTDYPRCVYCGSQDFRGVGGFLSSGTAFTDRMKCNFCNKIWYVTIDRNFNIIKVEKDI